MRFTHWMVSVAVTGLAVSGIIHHLEHERWCIHSAATTLDGIGTRDGWVSSDGHLFPLSVATDDPNGPANGGGGVGGGSRPSA